MGNTAEKINKQIRKIVYTLKQKQLFCTFVFFNQFRLKRELAQKQQLNNFQFLLFFSSLFVIFMMSLLFQFLFTYGYFE